MSTLPEEPSTATWNLLQCPSRSDKACGLANEIVFCCERYQLNAAAQPPLPTSSAFVSSNTWLGSGELIQDLIYRVDEQIRAGDGKLFA